MAESNVCSWHPAALDSYGARYSLFNDPRHYGNRGTKIDMQTDFGPSRHELFLLEDGEKKVEEDPETREFFPLFPVTTHLLLIPSQASPTQPCSPSTKKTTPSATSSAHI